LPLKIWKQKLCTRQLVNFGFIRVSDIWAPFLHKGFFSTSSTCRFYLRFFKWTACDGMFEQNQPNWPPSQNVCIPFSLDFPIISTFNLRNLNIDRRSWWLHTLQLHFDWSCLPNIKIFSCKASFKKPYLPAKPVKKPLFNLFLMLALFHFIDICSVFIKFCVFYF